MATQKQLQDALRKKYDRPVFVKEVLQAVFGNRLKVASAPFEATELNGGEKKTIKKVERYGEITLDDQKPVICYEVTLQDNVRIEQSKVAIQHYVRKHLITGQAALINFVSSKHPEYWRFTLVVRDSKLGESGIEKADSHPRRYTYLVETTGQNRTMAERLGKLSLKSDLLMDDLKAAFSVEAMSKAFFNEYKEHYQNFVEYLTGKRMVKEKGKWVEKKTGKASPYLKSIFNGDEKDARDFIKKLMGRIVFLYFVQKKGWLGASNTQYTDGDHDFIFTLFRETGGDEQFFPFGLTELFFKALNEKRKNDDWKTPDGRTVKIPYLNGGLFNRDEVDLLLEEKNDMLTFPPEYFANHKDAESPEGRGFLDFLNAYNFTVYEDSQDDHTVAVDPEMLGHIFENLLEDNKDKGAFYTPKEIVHYMCQESLTEYLATHLEKSHHELKREAIENLVRNKEADSLDNKQLATINTLLDKVKICDPAIGSGAFPMGLLHEIFSIKELIAYAKDEVLDSARVKENIIQNSIYGVDIERGAVDIARLRFWLSLVVDEEKPRELPNLDYKIVVGNSLLSKFEDEVIEIEWDLKSNEIEDMFGDAEAKKRRDLLADISKTQKDYFHPEKPADKDKLKKKIRNLKIDLLINQLELMIKAPKNQKGKNGQKGKSEFDSKVAGWEKTIQKLKTLKRDAELPFDHFDWKLDFPELLNPVLMSGQTGFDIVIGNPPYGININKEIDSDTVLHEPMLKKLPDSYCSFILKGFRLLKESGAISFIVPNTFCDLENGDLFRAFILREYTINNIWQSGWAFDSAVVDTLVFTAKNEKSSPEINVKIKLGGYQYLRSISSFINNELFKIDYRNPPGIREALQKIEAVSTPILKVCTVNAGVKIYEKGKGNPAQTESIVSDKPYTTTSRDCPVGWRVLYRGGDIERYSISHSGEFIHYGPWLAAPRSDELFSETKILMRRTDDRLKSAIDYDGAICVNSCHVIKILPEYCSAYTYEYILGILNSSVHQYVFDKYNPQMVGKVFSEIKVIYVERLPMPRATKHQIKTIGGVVKCRISLNDPRLDQLINGLVYELFFAEDFHKYKINLFDACEKEGVSNLGKIEGEDLSEKSKKMTDKIFSVEHPIRGMLFDLQGIEAVRIIEGKE